VAALALVGGGFAATAQAGEAGPTLLPPKGYTTVDTATASPKIIGGSDTTMSSAPWMVQLLYEWDNDGNFYFTCGGTLVAQNKILTAAHCVDGLDWVGHGLVLGGSAKIVDSAATAVSVKRVWENPSYNADAIDNDVALITLAKPLPYKTLPLAEAGDTTVYAPGTSATVYGWGLTGSSSNSSLANTLQHVDLPLQADADCVNNIDTALGAGTFKTGHMICAGEGGTGDDATGKATCPGDSGGPLVVGGKIVGIVSWGVSTSTQECNVAGFYEVFTKVSTYTAKVNPRVDDTNLNNDYRADLFTRASSGGKGYEYDSNGTSFGSRKQLAGDWSAYDTVLQTDLNRDGYQDFIIRRKSDGYVYWRHRSASSATYTNTKIFSWKGRKFIVAPGDVNGDRLPDLLSVTPEGALYLYPGKGNGTFGSAVQVGASGWTQYNALIGHGDFTGDGHADLIARNGKTVYVYPGTGSATKPFFSARVQVRNDWAYTKIVTTGDLTNDGIADVLARDSGGVLWLFKGTGKVSSQIFATGVRIGSGWNQYNIFG
jgi:hypothetical protein